MLHKTLLYTVLLCLWLPAAGQGRGTPPKKEDKGWKIAALNIFAGRGKSIITTRGFSEYLSKITTSKKALEKLQFDSWYRLDGNWVLQSSIVENNNFIGGAEWVLRPRGKRKSSFYERQEMVLGTSIFSARVGAIYNSRRAENGKTIAYTSSYSHKITDIRLTYSYLFYNPVINKKLDLFLGVTLYGSVSVGNTTVSAPTLSTESMIDSGKVVYAYKDNIFFKGHTNFMRPFYGYGVIVPAGLRVAVSEKSSIYCQGYLDFCYHNFARKVNPGLIHIGITAGYRRML